MTLSIKKSKNSLMSVMGWTQKSLIAMSTTLGLKYLRDRGKKECERTNIDLMKQMLYGVKIETYSKRSLLPKI